MNKNFAQLKFLFILLFNIFNFSSTFLLIKILIILINIKLIYSKIKENTITNLKKYKKIVFLEWTRNLLFPIEYKNIILFQKKRNMEIISYFYKQRDSLIKKHLFEIKRNKYIFRIEENMRKWNM